MSAVVADTGPVHYLIQTGHIELLPALFETIFIPETVRDEMLGLRTPVEVRTWIDTPPGWLRGGDCGDPESSDSDRNFGHSKGGCYPWHG